MMFTNMTYTGERNLSSFVEMHMMGFAQLDVQNRKIPNSHQ